MGEQEAAGYFFGGLAQLGERLPCKQEVTSSTLVFSMRYFRCRIFLCTLKTAHSNCFLNDSKRKRHQRILNVFCKEDRQILPEQRQVQVRGNPNHKKHVSTCSRPPLTLGRQGGSPPFRSGRKERQGISEVKQKRAQGGCLGTESR